MVFSNVKNNSELAFFDFFFVRQLRDHINGGKKFNLEKVFPIRILFNEK